MRTTQEEHPEGIAVEVDDRAKIIIEEQAGGVLEAGIVGAERLILAVILIPVEVADLSAMSPEGEDQDLSGACAGGHRDEGIPDGLLGRLPVFQDEGGSRGVAMRSEQLCVSCCVIGGPPHIGE